MGCSRPGALAVACVLAAGAMSMISLLLPYWSNMKIEVEAQENLELTFGLWGSCINLRPTNQTTVDAPVVMNGSEVIAIAPDNAASDMLTCGSYFDPEAIHITCTSFRQLASGQCQRHEYEAEGTLCDSDIAVDFLGTNVKASTATNWLSFLERACGRTGQASIVFGLLSSVFTGFGIVLLLFGITFTRIDSCIIRGGVICTATTAVCQAIVAILWAVESRVIHGEKVSYGTSFYLNIISLGLHVISSLAGTKHRRLEAEAHAATSADWIVEKNAAEGPNPEIKKRELIAV